MIVAGWICIFLEIVLLIIWIWSIFFSRNGTDPAGKGMAMVFILGLGIYVAAGIILLLLQRQWSTILALVMAAIPLSIVVIGLWKKYGPGKKQRY